MHLGLFLRAGLACSVEQSPQPLDLGRRLTGLLLREPLTLLIRPPGSGDSISSEIV